MSGWRTQRIIYLSYKVHTDLRCLSRETVLQHCHSGFQAASVDLVTGWHNGRKKQSFSVPQPESDMCHLPIQPIGSVRWTSHVSSHSCKWRWEIGPFFAHKGRETVLVNICNVYSHACKHSIICSSFCSKLNRNIPLILIYSFLQNIHWVSLPSNATCPKTG